MITESDVLAIRRVYTTAGQDAALSELRRRFMSLPENAVPMMLVKVLKLPIAPPAAFRERGDPVLDNRRRAMRG